MKKYIFAALCMTISLFSNVSFAKDGADILRSEIEKIDKKEFEIFGLYPGMSKADAIIEAKKHEKIRIINEDPKSPSGIIYETTDPKKLITIIFDRKSFDHYAYETNDEIKASNIDIVYHFTHDNRLVAEDFYKMIKKELGEPSDENISVRQYNLVFNALKPSEDTKIPRALCEEHINQKNSEISMGLIKLDAGATKNNLEFIDAHCPKIKEEYIENSAAKLGPSVEVKFTDGATSAAIYMRYKGESHFVPNDRKGFYTK